MCRNLAHKWGNCKLSMLIIKFAGVGGVTCNVCEHYIRCAVYFLCLVKACAF